MSASTALVLSFCKFLEEQLRTEAVFGDDAESLDVVLQCLKSVYAIDENTHVPGVEKIDLLDMIKKQLEFNRVPTEEEKQQADDFKNKGNELHNESKLEEAVDAYTQAIKLDGTNAIYYANRAAAFIKMGKYSQAVDDCRRAVELDPEYHKAYGRMGVAYKAMERISEAKECFRRAKELDPSNEQYKSEYDSCNATGPEGAGSPFPPGMPNFNQMFSDPNFMNSMMGMMQSPGMQDMMNGFMQNLQAGGGDLASMMSMGSEIAAQMEQQNPELVEQLRQARQQPTDGSAPNNESSEGNDTNSNNTEKKN